MNINMNVYNKKKYLKPYLTGKCNEDILREILKTNPFYSYLKFTQIHEIFFI